MPTGPDQDKQPPRQQGPGDQPPQPPQPRLGRGFFGWMVVLMILAMLAMVFHQSMNAGVRLETSLVAECKRGQWNREWSASELVDGVDVVLASYAQK